ncbi:hydrogenase maturation protease [Nitrospira sp. Kam-Ns4a]
MIRVLGFGNGLAGDDAVGVRAAERLRPLLKGRAEVIAAGLAGHVLVDRLAGADAVIVIDAVAGGGPAGTLYRWAWGAGRGAPPLEALRNRTSSHGWGVGDALALAGALGKLPPRLIVYGVEIGETTPGCSLGPAVARALDRLVRLVRREVERLACTSSP